MNELREIRSIETITAEILLYKRQAGAAILEIGQRLIEAKEQLGHGEWLPWLRDRVDLTERAAQRFMQLAKEYANPTLMSDLGPTKALVLLALPPEDRETFAKETDAAKRSVRELKEAIRERDEAKKTAAATKQQVQEVQAELDQLRGEKQRLSDRVQELENRPVDVAVKTVDASKKQIAQARKEAKAEVQKEINQLKAQLETKSTEAEPSGRVLAEINVLLKQMQASAVRIRDLTGQLDEVTRAKVLIALKTVLEHMGG